MGLLWYQHKVNGAPEWEGTKEVATGWADVKRIFSPGDGVIYAIRSSGELL